MIPHKQWFHGILCIAFIFTQIFWSPTNNDDSAVYYALRIKNIFYFYADFFIPHKQWWFSQYIMHWILKTCCIFMQIFWDWEQWSAGRNSHSLQSWPAQLHFYIPIPTCRQQMAQTGCDFVRQSCDFIRGLCEIVWTDYTKCWSHSAVFRYPIICWPAKPTTCTF